MITHTYVEHALREKARKQTRRIEVLIVFDLESDHAPQLLGTYEGTDDGDRLAYSDTEGRLRHAPEDCVRVVKVKV